jgi:hypothetical protein
VNDEDRVYAERRLSESSQDVSTSHLFAQISLSQKNDKHTLGTRMTWEEDPSTDARQSRPRPMGADLRRERLAHSGDRARAAAKRTFGSETPRAERDSEDGMRFSC